jgi:glycosyltransferase involved in cell wall biosynthesis
MPKICLIPKVHGIGGMVSFKRNFTAALTARGIDVCDDLDDTPCDAVLVIGGTRQIGKLWRARRRGVRVVQRLNGINWLHRRLHTGWRHFLRAEYGNRLLAFIRRRLATRIIYQSGFACGWWEDWFGPTPVPCAVVHNGVDLSVYSPVGETGNPHPETYRLLLVEGSLQGGYEMGLETALRLTEGLAERLPVELMVVGRVAPELQSAYQSRSRVPILWAGSVPGERIPELDRSAHLLYAADINAACPNSVIEALACGLPVLAFDTGALPELVTGDSGCIVPYGSDVWKLDPPDAPALVNAAVEMLADQPRFRRAARLRAEQAFGLDKMVKGYLEILLG